MKRVISKRFLSMALAIIMVAALIPAPAFATEGDVTTINFKNVSVSDKDSLSVLQDNTILFPQSGTAIDDPTVVAYAAPESKLYSSFQTPIYRKIANYEFYPRFYFQAKNCPFWPTSETYFLKLMMKIPADGIYRITEEAVSYKQQTGDFAVYINDKYAGSIYMADSANESWTKLKTTLNTMKLTRDEKGFVDVVFRPIGLYYNTGRGFLYPVETVFEEVASLSISDIEYTAPPAELAVGTTSDAITAKVKVSDGTTESYRFFHTHNGSAELDTANGVFVTSSDDSIVSVSERTIKDTDTTFSLTALKPGTATITVTAKVEGTEEDKVETFTVTVPGDAAAEPKTVTGEVSFGAYSDVANSVTVTIDGAASENAVESIAVGKTVKAVADTTNPAYKFLGWKRGSAEHGVWLTTDATVEFPIMTHTFLTAVYEPVADEDTINVEFYNYNGQYLDTAKDVGDTAFSAIAKPTPTLTGYSSPFWTLDGANEVSADAMFKKLTRIVAKYAAKDSFAVTIDSETIKGATTGTFAYDTELELESVSGKAGTWYVDEKTVAYGASYKHCVWGAASITFEAAEEETTAPIISLDDTAKTNGARMISYDANGKNIVEVGILFGENASVASCESKAASKVTGNAQGQFTAMPNSGTTATARGYLIYSDDEVYKVIYAN